MSAQTKLFPESLVVRLQAGMKQRIKAVLRQDESESSFMRELLIAEVLEREAKAIPQPEVKQP